MNILVTGTHGFVGKNLVAALQSIRDGKDRTRWTSKRSMNTAGTIHRGSLPLMPSPQILCSIWQG